MPLHAAAATPAPSEQAVDAGAPADIVVTARRKVERLQSTPVAVTAVSGADLQARQATSLAALQDIAPALQINRSSAFSGSSQTVAIFLRGIGQTDFTLNTDPGVGLYVDGVYVSRSVGALLDLVDVARVEVLRGPQGTLFGRNSVGGAISITSAAPAANVGATFDATFGTDNLRIFSASADLPVSDTLRTRISLQDDRQDGYVRRLSDGERLGNRNVTSGRFSAVWTPTDKLSVAIAADYSRSRENGAPLVLAEVNPNAAFVAAHNIVVAPTLNPALAGIPGGCASPQGAAVGGSACYDSRWITGDLSSTNATFPSYSNADVGGVGVTATYKLADNLSVKSISAYRGVHSDMSRDGDGSPLQINSTQDRYRQHQLSEELQLLGTALDNRLDYILGGFLFDERGSDANIVDLGVVRFLSGGGTHNRSAALFGQASYKLTSRLSATLGLRYTDERKAFTPDEYVLAAIPVPIFPPFLQFAPGDRLTTTARQKTNAHELTPHANLSYQASRAALFYASYSKGFKSGGFTQRIFPPLPTPPAFRPETASVYELGAKFDLFDHHLRWNSAAYLTDYHNLQTTVLVGIAPTTQNAATARIKGFESELTAIPFAGLTATGSIGYTDAYYRTLGSGISPTITLANAFPGTSRWTANASLAYALRPRDGLTLTPRMEWSYRSHFSFDAENLVNQAGYGTVNLSLTLADDRHGRSIALFGKNVGDRHYAIHGEQVLDPLGWKLIAPARGAEWGLRLKASIR